MRAGERGGSGDRCGDARRHARGDGHARATRAVHALLRTRPRRSLHRRAHGRRVRARQDRPRPARHRARGTARAADARGARARVQHHGQVGGAPPHDRRAAHPALRAVPAPPRPHRPVGSRRPRRARCHRPLPGRPRPLAAGAARSIRFLARAAHRARGDLRVPEARRARRRVLRRRDARRRSRAVRAEGVGLGAACGRRHRPGARSSNSSSLAPLRCRASRCVLRSSTFRRTSARASSRFAERQRSVCSTGSDVSASPPPSALRPRPRAPRSSTPIANAMATSTATASMPTAYASR